MKLFKRFFGWNFILLNKNEISKIFFWFRFHSVELEWNFQVCYLEKFHSVELEWNFQVCYLDGISSCWIRMKLFKRFIGWNFILLNKNEISKIFFWFKFNFVELEWNFQVCYLEKFHSVELERFHSLLFGWNFILLNKNKISKIFFWF